MKSLDNINQLIELVNDDLNKIDELIVKELNSDVALINELGRYIVGGGGKRIRPLITILMAKALNYSGEQHLLSAAFIEFIHTATLLHDDVVDESNTRRGKATAHVLFGNAASVLVGDYIYTRSFQMMVKLGSLPILKIMSEATNVIAEGEVQQLLNCNNPDITEADYFDVIYRKTARLFEVSAHIPAILVNASQIQEIACQNYGKYLGTAFQIMDDLLDYTAKDPAKLGKSLGDDLDEGKVTLPLLHAMKNAKKMDDVQLIKHVIIEGNGRKSLEKIVRIMDECGSIEYTQKRAEEEVQKAMREVENFPESIYKQGLILLAKMASERTY